MIEIKEALSRRQQKEFLEFPNHLYKGNPYYVPPLYLDEKKIFRKDYVYYDTCEAVYFNAYKDGVMSGRISGILQHSSNDKWGQKRVRFTRFDVVEDFEVAAALFKAVEDWARSKGMEEVCGPLGFSDLEREGLLIDGFDQMSTFEEAYNYDYYPKFIEKLGYAKEVDWVESQIRPSADPETREELRTMSEFVQKRYHLRIGEAKNTREFLAKYKDGFFDILDRSYEKIYGTVPFTEGMKKMMIENFNLIIDTRYVAAIVNEEDSVVAMGICFPSIAKPMQKCGGHITPWNLPGLLRAIKKPEVIDFGLIGVDPEYANRGVSVILANGISEMLSKPGIKYADTNLNLEDNAEILNLWKRFDARQNKRRRSYLKKLV